MLTARIGKNTPKLCKRQTADFLRTRRTLDRILQKERGKARLHPQRRQKAQLSGWEQLAAQEYGIKVTSYK